MKTTRQGRWWRSTLLDEVATRKMLNCREPNNASWLDLPATHHFDGNFLSIPSRSRCSTTSSITSSPRLHFGVCSFKYLPEFETTVGQQVTDTQCQTESEAKAHKMCCQTTCKVRSAACLAHTHTDAGRSTVGALDRLRKVMWCPAPKSRKLSLGRERKSQSVVYNTRFLVEVGSDMGGSVRGTKRGGTGIWGLKFGAERVRFD